MKQAVVSAVASIAVVSIGGGIAFAHVDPDPIAMQAGTTGAVAFNIEHGCDGSPTTGMKIQIPDGVTGVAPVDKAGWTATVTGNVVQFTGGPLAADQHDHFDITLTAPAQAGEIRFPTIQTCQQGELAWIEIPAEGAAEPEHPAPTLKITDGPPTSADLVPPAEEDDSAGGTVAPVSATVAPTSGGDSSSNTGVIVVVVAAVVVVGGGGVLVARRRRPRPGAEG